MHKVDGIIEIEELIEELKRDEYFDKKVRETIFLGICQYCDLSFSGTASEEDALSAISNCRNSNKKRLVAAALWRLIPYRSTQWLTERAWRLKIVTLMEEAFPEIQLDDKGKLQAHQKIEEMTKKLSEIERELKGSLDLLTSFDQFKSHKEKMLKVLNKPLGQILIKQFLVDDVIAQIGEIYKKIDIYIGNYNTLEVIESHKYAIRAVAIFKESLQIKKSYYANIISNQMLDKLHEMLENHLAQNVLAKPSEITVRKFDKKYPLHVTGNRILIGIVVENEGPGIATDIEIEVMSDEKVGVEDPFLELSRLEPKQPISTEFPAIINESSDKVRESMGSGLHNCKKVI